jgi:hypothetical protein
MDSARPAAPATNAPFVTYRLNGGHVYELAVRPGARPLDVSAALDRLSPGTRDEWLNASSNGRWLLVSSERFGCEGWACLARAEGSLRHGAAVRTPRGVLHADSFGAISSDGALVVYPAAGGPHTRDLWATRLVDGQWTSPKLLTADSRFEHNTQPAISPDGQHVLFDCGPGLAGDPGTSICETSTTGGLIAVVIAPDQGPHGSSRNEVHHAAYGPGRGVTFEADWHGEQIWRLPSGSRRPVLVSRVHDDNSPCVLPDRRIASLYLDRPGNRSGVHELRVTALDGSNGAEILTGADILDIGIGCG